MFFLHSQHGSISSTTTITLAIANACELTAGYDYACKKTDEKKSMQNYMVQEMIAATGSTGTLLPFDERAR